jgi:pilus assembly protein Flp/PilA
VTSGAPPGSFGGHFALSFAPNLPECFAAAIKDVLEADKYVYACALWRVKTRRLHGARHPKCFRMERNQAMRTLIWNFLLGEEGATAIEYGLIAAGISVAIIAVVEGLGTNLANTFSSVSSALR